MTKAKSTGKIQAEFGLLQAVRDMKAGRAARVYVPDGKGRVVRSEVARARLLRKTQTCVSVDPRL